MDGRQVAWTVSGADLGLARLGPADADTCVITPDALSGSVLAARFPDKLIVIAAPMLSRWTERQLVAEVGDRAVEIYTTGSPGTLRLLDQLEALLPRIKIFADAVGRG